MCVWGSVHGWGRCWAQAKSHSIASSSPQGLGLSSHLQQRSGGGCRTPQSSPVGSLPPHSTPFPWLGAVTPPAVCPTL